MSKPQIELSEASKQGNPRAIAALMNRSLQPKGITVKAFMQKDRLNIVLESVEVPPQAALVSFTRKGLNSLGITTIKTVRVHGKQQGTDSPCWMEEFSLSSYVEPVDAIVISSTTTAHLTQPTQKAKTTTQKSAIAKRKSSGLKRSWILIAAGSASVVVLFGLGGLAFWLRSAQNAAIADAQELIETGEQGDDGGNLQALKASEENLQQAIVLLEDAPKLPLINVASLETTLNDTQTKLAEVEEEIEAYEALLPKIQDAFDQVSALNSSLDVGMNYRDYGSEVRNVKVAIDRLGRESGISDNSIYQDLETAYKHYEFAYNVWNYYIESDESHSFFPASSSYGQLLTDNYKVPTQNIVGTSYIYLDTALSKVWSAAGESVQEAQAKLEADVE